MPVGILFYFSWRFSRRQETSLDDFSSALKERWEARIRLEQQEKEAAKVAKQKEMEIKKEVCSMFCVARAHAFACVCVYVRRNVEGEFRFVLPFSHRRDDRSVYEAFPSSARLRSAFCGTALPPSGGCDFTPSFPAVSAGRSKTEGRQAGRRRTSRATLRKRFCDAVCVCAFCRD